jgi:hypothetical protein
MRRREIWRRALEQLPHVRTAGEPMKRILDSDFQYRPSFDTDVKKTFERIRRQQQLKDHAAAQRETAPYADRPVKILNLDELKKKASNTAS